MNKRLLVSLGLSLVGLGLFGFIFYTNNLTPDALLQALRGADPFWIGTSFLLVAFFYLFSSLKWRLVTHSQASERFGVFFYYRYIALSAALGQILPLTLINAAVRAFAMRRKDVMPVMKSTGLFIWDMGFDFLALTLLMLAGMTHVFLKMSWSTAALLWAGSVILVYLIMPLFIRLASGLAGILAGIRLLPAGIRDRFSALKEANILDAALARKLFVLGCGKFLVGSVLYAVIVLAFGHGEILSEVFWGGPSAEMAGVLSQMPGGLGAFDWTWVGIFRESGLVAQTAASLAVGLRCILVLLNCSVAFCTLSVYFILVRIFGLGRS